MRTLEEPRAINALIELTKDKDESVRTQAIHGLMPFDTDRRVHAAILAMLDDEDPRVRANACIALAMQGHREDGRRIERLLNDDFDTVRLNAGIAVDALKAGTRDGRLAWQMNRFTYVEPITARSELNDLTQNLLGVAMEVSRGDGQEKRDWSRQIVTQKRVLLPPGMYWSKGKYLTNKGRISPCKVFS
jgi:hypothetical protein